MVITWKVSAIQFGEVEDVCSLVFCLLFCAILALMHQLIRNFDPPDNLVLAQDVPVRCFIYLVKNLIFH